MCDNWNFDNDNDFSGSGYGMDEASPDTEIYSDLIENSNEPVDSILGSSFDTFNYETSILGPVPQEIFVKGRYLLINLDGTVTTIDNQIVCTIQPSEVGTVCEDDIRIINGLKKLEGYTK